MNRSVVRRTTAGLARFVQGQQDRPPAAGVVVGHDARHGSAEFALDVARVSAAAGLQTWWSPTALPTPITAFAVRHLGAAVGVVVTASHNPAPDNGYKVYVSDGGQVLPHEAGAITEAAASSPACLTRNSPARSTGGSPRSTRQPCWPPIAVPCAPGCCGPRQWPSWAPQCADPRKYNPTEMKGEIT